MAELKPCQECDQKHKCQDIYQQLGKAKGPSVVFKAVVAFLLPLLIFIVSLAAFERILAGTTDLKSLRTALDFLLALSVTLVAILIIKAISKRLNKNE
ncbi:MAG: SoxR reducing system RseC family protein [Phycisphaerae bacterium]|nr:SoxR reducing system RseC family protein [Phycisphaerae bacterium]MDD5381459.1 SoxR reducing system RseC family protein [Phycisphaerae bacterium]